MTRTRLTLTLLAAAALGGCATKPLPPKQVGDLSPGSFQVSWSADTGMKAPRAFYLVGDLLFVYDKGNGVSAYDLDGGLKFRVSVGERGDIIGQPIVEADRIIFPSSSTLEVYTRSGVKTKAVILPQPVRSPGVGVGDSVYVGSDSDTGGRLAAIDLTRTYNIYKWTRLTGIINTKPALFDNVLYCGTEDGRVYAVNLDGSPLWAPGPEMPNNFFRADGKIIATIKADDAGIFVPSTDTKLYCLAPNTGRVRWQFFAGVPLTASPAVTADMVYQYVEGTGLVGLPKKSTDRTVTPKWTYADGKQLVADDSKYAYVLNDDNAVVALKKDDGAVAFMTKRNDLTTVVTAPDAKNPAVYAITESGQLICIKPVLKTGVVGELAMLTP